MVAFYVLLALAALRILLLLVGAAFLIRPISACPACFRPSVRIHRPWLARIAPWYEWRWCPHCGWQGVARAPRPRGGRPTGHGRGRAPP